MNAEQRRQLISRRLLEDSTLSQQSIAAELGISQSQAQRDIAELRRSGILPAGNPAHGGRPAGSVATLQINGAPSAGEELVGRLRAEMEVKGLEPDAREEGLLAQIRDAADTIAKLRERIDAEGLTFKPSTPGGPPRMHPAAAEARQTQTVLARLLEKVQLESATTRDPVKQRAANARWRPRQLQKARYAAGEIG